MNLDNSPRPVVRILGIPRFHVFCFFGILLTGFGVLIHFIVAPIKQGHDQRSYAFAVAHTVIGKGEERLGQLPEINGPRGNWRDVLRALNLEALRSDQDLSHLDPRFLERYRLTVLGIDSPISVWGKLQRNGTSWVNSKNPNEILPLLVLIPEIDGLRMSSQSDVWTDDPYQLVQYEQHEGGIPCFAVCVNLGVYPAFFYPSAGREVLHDGFGPSGLW